MAIRTPRTQPQTQPFAMAPMVDMVFLLLVFFMCVTAVSGGRARLKLDLPQTAAATAGGAAKGSPQIVLSIAAAGALEIDGVPCEQVELLPRLRRLRAQTPAVVRVRADAATPYQAIAPVLAACRAAGFATVSYAATEARLEQQAPAAIGTGEGRTAASDPASRATVPATNSGGRAVEDAASTMRFPATNSEGDG